MTAPNMVHFRPGARTAIIQVLAQRKGRETGGILVGAPPSETSILVTHAFGPGPRALRAYHRFQRDTAWSQEQLSEIQRVLPVEWIGDWHSHPGSLAEPSDRDIATARALVADPDLRFDRYLMVIIGTGALRPPVAAWLFNREGFGKLVSTDLGPPEFDDRGSSDYMVLPPFFYLDELNDVIACEATEEEPHGV